jgi:hypothetical protein
MSMAFHSIRLYDTSRAFQCTVSDLKTEAKTVAFGYPARALVFEQRVELGPLAIRDMRRR